MNQDEGVIALDAIEAAVEPHDWAFPRENAEAIEAFWAAETVEKPALYDGEVLIQHRGALEGGIFRAGYSFTRYKPFLAWHRMGFPGPPMRNGFAVAALRARDDAYLLGEMAAHTANAGKIYFPAGTPDRGDVLADGSVDLAGSVLRELEEETGLGAGDVQVGTEWKMVLGKVRATFFRPVLIDLAAEDARRLMLDRMKSLPEQELSAIHIVRGIEDLDPARMPVFLTTYLSWAFGQRA